MADTLITAVGNLPEQPRHVAQHGEIFELPDFTMKEIYDAIPPHCFKSSASRSLFYVARDFGYISILVYASSFIRCVPVAYARALLWTVYTILQGMVFTGIWILAHECGHGAFSKYKKLNWAMGFLMHSFLLVPFHSWRITHNAHHKGTGNLDKDMAFVPPSRKAWIGANFSRGAGAASTELGQLAEDTPLVVLWNCLVHQLFGWPGYLLFNITGQKYSVPFPKQSHFYAGQDSPFWKKKQLPLIVLSDIGVTSMIAILVIGGYFFGSLDMLRLYAIPYLWVNHWIGEL
jgi:omega-6 fatty acid desaturase / acyl-lipid omega-6 desaturase (Delta-12 desaturase)